MKLYTAILLVVSLLLRACSQQAPAEGNEAVENYPKGDQTYLPANLRPILDRQQKAAFNFFYEGAESGSGMSLEGNNRGNTITIGGSGFGVMALVVGMERGWITREQGIEQIQRMLRFLKRADRYKGVWSHWHNPDGSYAPFGNQIATGDLVETSFLLEGLLVAYEYLDKGTPEENAIRADIDALYDSVDWAGYTGPQQDGLYWLWYSQEDRYVLKITGWNEALVTYLLALGATEKGVSAEVYQKGWNVPVYPGRKVNAYPFPLGREEKGGPLFFSHYSFLGFDPRHMADANAWYWQQNLSHTMLNRHYCLYEAPKENDYGPGLWGLTACYGAGSTDYYSARNPSGDDGVMAPTAALSSFPYTPFYSAQVLVSLDRIRDCQGQYGLADSFKPSERAATRNHLAIDQGPMVVMMENYRSGLIWNLFMRNARVQRALQKAGIGEPKLDDGFPYVVADSRNSVVDLMAHPDREKYELDCYSSMPGQAHFSVALGSTGETIQEFDQTVPAGVFRFSFDDTRITRGEKYLLAAKLPSGETFRLEVVLH
ncbi:MAG: hypothetical protein J6M31_09225 [Bacteroidales bacterium]|nr:hypothetical protein [Bacteroidales bacterium]